MTRDRTTLWIGLVVVLLVVGFVSFDLMSSNRGRWLVVTGAPIVIALFADRMLCRHAKGAVRVDGERLHRQRLARMNQELLVRLSRDALTDLHNRRSFDEFIDYYLHSPEFRLQSLSIVMLDLDQFKSINDRFGHLAGDAVLSGLASRWKALIRGSDLLARFGGDEFCLVLPNTTLTQAAMIAEKIREATSGRAVSVEQEDGRMEVQVSVSLGVATADSVADVDIKALLSHADRALYGAKAKGRNAVVTHRYA